MALWSAPHLKVGEETKYSLRCHKRDQCLSRGSDNTASEEMVQSPETVLLIVIKQGSGSSKTLRARIF